MQRRQDPYAELAAQFDEVAGDLDGIRPRDRGAIRPGSARRAEEGHSLQHHGRVVPHPIAEPLKASRVQPGAQILRQLVVGAGGNGLPSRRSGLSLNPPTR